MRIKAIYRKNLKMTDGKLAAQVAHAVGRLLVHGKAAEYISDTEWNVSIACIGVSDKKFQELSAEKDCHIQADNGVTEVPAGTQTAAAYIENK